MCLLCIQVVVGNTCVIAIETHMYTQVKLTTNITQYEIEFLKYQVSLRHSDTNKQECYNISVCSAGGRKGGGNLSECVRHMY